MIGNLANRVTSYLGFLANSVTSYLGFWLLGSDHFTASTATLETPRVHLNQSMHVTPRVHRTPRVHLNQSMHVIVFASRKGGSGKTTLCGQLAVQADLLSAAPVALIDTDPQGSLADWWNAREAETPVFVKTHFLYIQEHLNELRDSGIKLVFIDTPPAVTETIKAVVRLADLVIIPTRPSPHDLRAVGATVDIIESLEKPLVFAVNGAIRRARITSETAVALSQHGTVAPVTVHQRIGFATSMIDGRSVTEINPNSPAANEVVELWQYISSRLAKIDRRQEQRPFDGPHQRHPNHGRPFGRVVTRPTFGHRTGELAAAQQAAK